MFLRNTIDRPVLSPLLWSCPCHTLLLAHSYPHKGDVHHASRLPLKSPCRFCATVAGRNARVCGNYSIAAYQLSHLRIRDRMWRRTHANPTRHGCCWTCGSRKDRDTVGRCSRIGSIGKVKDLLRLAKRAAQQLRWIVRSDARKVSTSGHHLSIPASTFIEFVCGDV
jgi:hypothetical protein